jgi:hypothetical protein
MGHRGVERAVPRQQRTDVGGRADLDAPEDALDLAALVGLGW